MFKMVAVKPFTNYPIVKKLEMAQDLNTSGETLARLAVDEYNLVRADVAGNWNTPLSALLTLLSDPDEIVKQNLARNPALTPSMLDVFITDKLEKIARAVISNPNLTGEQLRQLAKRSKTFYEEIASHPNSPKDLLQHIYENPIYDSNNALAANPNTPVEILVKLFNNPDEYIKYALSTNPNLPAPLLEIYSDMTEHPDVIVNIAANPATANITLTKLYNNGDVNVLINIATNPNTPLHILEEMFNNKTLDPSVHYMLAKNPNIPQQFLEEMFNLRSRLYNINLAKNPSTPEHILLELIVADDEKIRTAAYYNPNLDPELRVAQQWAGGIVEDWFKEQNYRKKRNILKQP